MNKWRVFLDDGMMLDSDSTQWSNVPDKIIAVKIWYPTRKLLLYGLSHYGHPDTIKAGVDVDNEQFEQILAQAVRSTWPLDSI